MRRLVVTENMTLDGVIEAKDGWFSPAGDEAGVDNSDVEAVIRGHMAAQDALLLGRVTFEEFRAYWPPQTDDTTGITRHLNEVSKYVVSRTLHQPEWENTEVLDGHLPEAIRTLKNQPGGEIGVTGSITLVHELIAGGFVDEYRLFVYPTVLGSGRRLFADASNALALNLVEAKPFRSDIVLLTYTTTS